MKKLLLISTCLLVLLFSCKKQDTTVTKYQVDGLWLGTSTVDNDPTAPGVYFYSYVVYPDGSILAKGLGADGNYYYSTGSWQLSSNNIFSATITTIKFSGPPVTQAITATFSDSGIMTDGVWRDTQNGTQTGKYSTMVRVK